MPDGTYFFRFLFFKFGLQQWLPLVASYVYRTTFVVAGSSRKRGKRLTVMAHVNPFIFFLNGAWRRSSPYIFLEASKWERSMSFSCGVTWKHGTTIFYNSFSQSKPNRNIINNDSWLDTDMQIFFLSRLCWIRCKTKPEYFETWKMTGKNDKRIRN